MTRPMHEQINHHDPFAPIIRRASAPATSTHARPRSVGTQASRPPADTEEAFDDDLDDATPPRASNSALRYPVTRQQVYTRGNQRLVIHHEPPPAHKAKPTWVLFVCIGMVLMTVGWLALTYVGNWWTNQENTWSYGYPRTYQTDIVAFKHDTPVNPTHVMVVNLNGKVETIIFPHGDASHAKMYLGPTIYSDNASLVPVTATFEDVDGSGRLAMIVHVGNQRIVYPNDGSAFQPPK